MGRFALMTTGFAGVVAAVGLWGCGASSTSSPAPEIAKTSTTTTLDEGDGHHHGHDDHSGHGDHASHGGHGDMDKMKEELAKLSEADRASAEKQHICPVTGEMLGTMGRPIKLSVKGQDVWICCDGCRKSLENDPDKYLAKLNK